MWKICKHLVSNKVSDGGSNQNLILFIRGNAMSGAPGISGTSQFPNPPITIDIIIGIIIGITIGITSTNQIPTRRNT
jgi:hypothetical protein